MNIDMVELRSQLAPGWSGVNIALMIILFLLSWPLGLLMIAYIVWGHTIGLDLSRPQTFRGALSKIGNALRAAMASFNNQPNETSGTPRPDQDSFDQWRKTETDKLSAERQNLERQKAEFEAEKKAFDSSKR